MWRFLILVALIACYLCLAVGCGGGNGLDLGGNDDPGVEPPVDDGGVIPPPIPEPPPVDDGPPAPPVFPGD